MFFLIFKKQKTRWVGTSHVKADELLPYIFIATRACVDESMNFLMLSSFSVLSSNDVNFDILLYPQPNWLLQIYIDNQHTVSRYFFLCLQFHINIQTIFLLRPYNVSVGCSGGKKGPTPKTYD